MASGSPHDFQAQDGGVQLWQDLVVQHPAILRAEHFDLGDAAAQQAHRQPRHLLARHQIGDALNGGARHVNLFGRVIAAAVLGAEQAASAPARARRKGSVCGRPCADSDQR